MKYISGKAPLVTVSATLLLQVWRSRPWLFRLFVPLAFASIYSLFIFIIETSPIPTVRKVTIVNAIAVIALGPINLVLIPLFSVARACWHHSQRYLLPHLRAALWLIISLGLLLQSIWIWLTIISGWPWPVSIGIAALNVALVALGTEKRSDYLPILPMLLLISMLLASDTIWLALPAITLCIVLCFVCLNKPLGHFSNAKRSQQPSMSSPQSAFSFTRFLSADGKRLTQISEKLLQRLDLALPRHWLRQLDAKASRPRQLAIATWSHYFNTISQQLYGMLGFFFMLLMTNGVIFALHEPTIGIRSNSADALLLVLQSWIPFIVCVATLGAMYHHFVTIRPSIARVWLAGTWRDSAHFNTALGRQLAAKKFRTMLFESAMLILAAIMSTLWPWYLYTMALLNLILVNALGIGILLLMLRFSERLSATMRAVSLIILLLSMATVFCLSNLDRYLWLWSTLTVGTALGTAALWATMAFGRKRPISLEFQAQPTRH